MFKDETNNYKSSKYGCKLSERGPIMMWLLFGEAYGLEIEIDGHGYFVPGVEEGDHFVSFIEGIVA